MNSYIIFFTFIRKSTFKYIYLDTKSMIISSIGEKLFKFQFSWKNCTKWPYGVSGAITWVIMNRFSQKLFYFIIIYILMLFKRVLNINRKLHTHNNLKFETYGSFSSIIFTKKWENFDFWDLKWIFFLNFFTDSKRSAFLTYKCILISLL